MELRIAGRSLRSVGQAPLDLSDGVADGAVGQVPGTEWALPVLVEGREGGEGACDCVRHPVGVERSEIVAMPAIADYCARFAIAPDEQRLTGAAPGT
jgi:hypothetical protein